MSDQPEQERKMTLRFSTDIFEQLDEKRFRLRTTFQAVGHNLFVSWLAGEKTFNLPQDSNREGLPTLSFDAPSATLPWHNLLELILRHGPDDTCNAIRENLRTFARTVFLEINLENAERDQGAAGSFDPRLQAIEAGLRDVVLAPGKERVGKARNSRRNQSEKRSA